MRSARSSSLKRFLDGVRLALSDDGAIGTNDVPHLQVLAKSTGLGEAERLADAFARTAKDPFVPARGRVQGTGYARRIIAFEPGPGAGFNAHRLQVALGRPEGAGLHAGSLDVVSLGQGGRITLELGRDVTRGLVVFGNAFLTPNGGRYAELARVEVSPDQQQWFTLASPAGLEPVLANRANRLPARSRAAGGDRFLFADSGIPAGTPIRYVRVTDLGGGFATPPTAGFDLDAVYGF